MSRVYNNRLVAAVLRLQLGYNPGRDFRMPTKTTPQVQTVRRLESYNARQTELRWIRENGHGYPGQWIAVEGDRLIAHGSDVMQVFAEVDRAGIADPLFVHMEPDDRLAEIGGW
jgi:hypothetical protein